MTRRRKLTSDDVLTMRQRFTTGEATHSALAREYGVTQATVSAALRGVTWNWLEPWTFTPKQQPGQSSRKLTPDEIRAIRARAPRTEREVMRCARDYGVHWQTIYSIIRGNTYADVDL